MAEVESSMFPMGQFYYMAILFLPGQGTKFWLGDSVYLRNLVDVLREHGPFAEAK